MSAQQAQDQVVEQEQSIHPVAGCAPGTPLTKAAAPIVDLGYAQYQGTVDTSTNITTFLGIRYAAAPIDELRFRAPQPPTNITRVQQATMQPNRCFQASSGTLPTNPLRPRAIEVDTGEDCLFLSILFPRDADRVPQRLLPTIVWIHGGGYLAESSSMYRGTDLIHESNRGVVAIVIQYGLGVFGFLPGQEVKKNGTLNAGLLDQDFALRWVNKYIFKFGGDPSKVTIWGESAGTGSVLQQVVANDGQRKPQLFREAITSSTFLPSQYKYNNRIPELLYSEVVDQTNCTAAADSVACLRTADVNALENANLNINAAGFFGTWVFIPVVDDEFIKQRPMLSLAQGKVNGEALLSVTNTFEGNDFVNQSTADTANAPRYALDLFPNFGPTEADCVGALYGGLSTHHFKLTLSKANQFLYVPHTTCSAPLAVTPGRANSPSHWEHITDVPYYFPSYEVDNGITFAIFNNTAFVNAFAQLFTSFAISLDPNVKIDPTTITPEWNKWDVRQVEMLFNIKLRAMIPL
ncbi:Alpha/Beta hydrolase protein [Mycena rosella]|uniref:Carboxylic ester hydrolase n=1 Tax=Mycena rosella TaxID=1033263 RepID=A0AAD7DL70_MYCRO|nr:Alpha/Beta hydrolase protein [Mycena rosella]